MRGLGPLRSNLGPAAVVLALLFAVSFLPPDTSLGQVERTGTLRACVPDAYPPLVTGDPERPGIDVELLRAIAAKLGVSLSLNRITAIGRDFNPRNWGITRASCELIAGGVVDGPVTRSFLSAGPAYAETGWAAIAPRQIPNPAGQAVAVLTLLPGLDRVKLATYLRSIEAQPRIVQRPEDLEAMIEAKEVEVGVTEALLARQIALERGWRTEMLQAPLARHDLIFGLWKGDLTLKRAIERAFSDLEAEGEINDILEAYLGDQS